MGSNPSNLTPNTLLALKKFRVFEDFPKDCREADAIIANEATNALKHVSCNVASRLGGHRNRKLVSISQQLNDNITPTRRSQRTVQTQSLITDTSRSQPSRNDHLPYTPSPTANVALPDNTSSIVTSSISYRLLLPHDLFHIGNDTGMVLVVDKESYGLKKSIVSSSL